MYNRRYNTEYYYTPAWYARCDAVRWRARGRCEFCLLRPMQQTHHRTYEHFEHEPLCDLMGVCDLCHRAIHRLVSGRTIRCLEESLLYRDDCGMGTSALWTEYLRTHPDNPPPRVFPAALMHTALGVAWRKGEVDAPPKVQ
jgi:hypothetical protein